MELKIDKETQLVKSLNLKNLGAKGFGYEYRKNEKITLEKWR
jgi:hypothetical protein